MVNFPVQRSVNQQAGDEKLIVTINGEKVTAGALRKLYMDQMSQLPNEQKGLEATLMIREQLANQLIAQTIALQAAKRAGGKAFMELGHENKGGSE